MLSTVGRDTHVRRKGELGKEVRREERRDGERRDRGRRVRVRERKGGR